GGQFCFAEAAFGERQINWVQLDVVRIEHRTVEHNERFADDCGSALVTINKRMIACDAERETGSECSEIRRRISVCIQLLRTRERGIEQAVVAHAAAAAMLS